MELLLRDQKENAISKLRNEILLMEGHKSLATTSRYINGLEAIESAFPDNIFPTAAVHEFFTYEPEHAAATNGFISALLSQLIKNGTVIWVSSKRTLSPPALSVFGIKPERIIFIDLVRQKDVLWAIEEALKCDAISAVIGELTELDFTGSRRLQLAVEQSRVMGIIHRYRPRTENVTACVSRWKIKSIASDIGIPGVGFPRWDVQLQKVRNGKPGRWQIEWSAEQFRNIAQKSYSITEIQKRKTG